MNADQIAEFQFAGQDLPWLLGHWAEARPDHPLLIWEPRDGNGRTWTYRQFRDDVHRIAAGLHGRGIVKGDKVLIHSDNSPEMVLSWYACATLGAVAVTTNTRSVGAEIEYFIDKAGCVAAITQPQYAAVIAGAGPKLKWIAVTEDNSGAEAPADQLGHGHTPFADLYGDAADVPARPPEPMLPAGIQFTSGTTSRPKAVVHTHANALWAGRVGPRNIDMTGDDTYLIYLPFFHVNAQSWSLWTTLGVGGTVVLQPKFSASRFWEVIAAHSVTHISLIPFVFKAIAGQPIPEHTVKVGVFGLIMPELDAWLQMKVVPGWGMTETVIHATCIDPATSPPLRSMGKPTPGYEFMIINKETGEQCATDEVGELWVRGTRGIQLFLEYYDNPEAMAKGFTDDGWFKTGDMVSIGEGGNFFYSERDGDVLKVGGENVSAREIEDLCRQVPGIADIAVVGREHEMLDVVPVVFLITNPDADDEATLEKAIIELCQANLADFKVPRAVYVVDDFPRATLDKVAKNQLRDIANSMPERG